MRMLRATFAINPAGMAVGIVFFFPDGQPHFHLIDDVTAGIECLVPVRGRYADPDGAFADFQHAGPVYAMRVKDREPCSGLGNDFLALADGQWLVRFILQSLDTMAFILVSVPAFETGVGACRLVEELAPLSVRVDALICHPDHVSPRQPVETKERYHRR